VAEVLLEREILDGQQLHDYLDRVDIPPLLATWLRTGEISLEPKAEESILQRRGYANALMGNGFNSKHLHENLS
jgi:hypothetical protein